MHECVDWLFRSAKKNGLGIVQRESLLFAILLFMKNAFEGNGMVGSQVGYFASAVLHKPGMRNVLFLVCILRSRMGFPVVVHVILGSDLTFPETYFFDELLHASLAIVLEE